MTKYKLVPVKPTPKMEAVFKRFQIGRCEWNVLLAAAPEPDVEPIGEVQIEQLDRPFNAGKVVLHFYGEPPPVGTKLYATPPITDAEPVAWVKNLSDPQPHCVTDLAYRSIADILNDVEYLPLYTAPPQREWVGLTDEEAAECWDASAVQTWKNIEAKLKEKNT